MAAPSQREAQDGPLLPQPRLSPLSPLAPGKRKKNNNRRKPAAPPPAPPTSNQPIPMKQVFSNSSSNVNPSPSNFSNRNPNEPTTRWTTQTLPIDMSEEFICINKEATTEALVVLSAGFPADSLTEKEMEAGVVSVIGGLEQVSYIIIPNHILSRLRENVSAWLSNGAFLQAIPPHYHNLLDSAYNFMLSHGYINFGVAPAIKERLPVEPTRSNVVIIGAGLAGLAAARQLMASGFKVVVLEGRKRAGGRVYTKKMEGGNKVASADLGGSVLTGTLGNPLGILAKQLSYPLHKVWDKCPLYKTDGQPVDPVMDIKIENAFNRLLDKESRLRQLMGEVAVDVSLGAALETFREVYGDAVNMEEMSLSNWHLANLEYANTGLLSKLSLAFWDQDDPYDIGVPLGVLKSNSIRFIPELPQRKLDGIKRLGFRLLNKVAMLFSHVFWELDLDTFGHLSDDPMKRGAFFLFYSYATVAGGPLLIALVAGDAAHRFESMPPTDAVTRVLQILRGIYGPKGINVPEPIQTVCTRWGRDPLSLGSYSHVAVGASGDDYDILAENVGDGRLFFAGEETTRHYPATMHGAFLSDLREAANISHYANARSLKAKVERGPSKNLQSRAALLADLFRQPDLEFGSFAVLFGPQTDPKPMAILRVTIGGTKRKGTEGPNSDQQHSNKLLFQQLQSHFTNSSSFMCTLCCQGSKHLI
ncbi:hypothetical protein AMTR_s00015p00090420 [Amborella trichopoda]|uniref:SWIRM domain-containing protein n=1 Tax=Amborella trichopoda TaxID=13333 RepID=W1PM43_AMBTC|nr:hypothetical protein AMTR_s00015p00090420 [Amborella trichopoda]